MVSRGERVEITRRGEVVAVIVPPDRSEVLLDRLASEGNMPADWRQRQHRLCERLRQHPMAQREPGATDRLRSAAGRPRRDRSLIYLDSSALIKLVLPEPESAALE